MLFIPAFIAIILIIKGIENKEHGMIVTGIIFAVIQALGIIGLIFYGSITSQYQNNPNVILPKLGKTAYIVINTEEYKLKDINEKFFHYYKWKL